MDFHKILENRFTPAHKKSAMPSAVLRVLHPFWTFSLQQRETTEDIEPAVRGVVLYGLSSCIL